MGNIVAILTCRGEARRGEAPRGEALPSYSSEANRYATIDEVWEWGYVECGGALNKIRRQNTPVSYTAIVDLVGRISEGTITAHDQSGKEDYKTVQSANTVFNKVLISIIGNDVKNKAHQLPAAKSCRCYYGPVAECVAGLKPIPQGKRVAGWNCLLSGLAGEITDENGERKNMKVKGLEKLAENFLVLNKPHDGIYDTFDDGILLTLPITTLEEALNWKKGDKVDFLVLADHRGYSAPFKTKVPGLLTEAKPEDIEKARKFVGDIIAALTDLLSSDFPTTMEYALSEDAFAGKEGERKTALAHLEKLKELQKTFREPDKLGKALVPTKSILKKPLMKINMRVWMDASNCGKNNEDGTYPYPDPLLAGVKSGNGLYFAKTCKKLLPGCRRGNDGDDTDNDSEESGGYPLHMIPPEFTQGDPIRPITPFVITPEKPRPSDIQTPLTRPLDDDELSDISAVE